MPSSVRPPRSQLRTVTARKSLEPRVLLTHPGPPSLPVAALRGRKICGVPVSVNLTADINPITALNIFVFAWCSRPGENCGGWRHAAPGVARVRQADSLRTLDGTADAANR